MLHSAEEQLQSTVSQLQVAQQDVVKEADKLKSLLLVEQDARTALQRQVEKFWPLGYPTELLAVLCKSYSH